MWTRKRIRWKGFGWSSFGILGIMIFIPIAQAQQSIDITDTIFATGKMLLESKELTIYTSEVWGIATSNNENKAFENMTSYCLAMRKFVAGRPQKSLTYSKFTDKDGDFFVVETIGSEAAESDWTFLQGTGKWKGITGGGKSWFTIRMVKGGTPGTFHGRVRLTGTFELPK